MDFSLERAETLLGEKAEAWHGRCFEIASRLVTEGFAPSELSPRAILGEYRGPISSESEYAGEPAWIHGWIETSAGIIDHTRWTFEGVEPYVYVGTFTNDYGLPGDL